MEFFERISFTLKEGTGKVIDGYLENYPDMWENRSHFIRCALEREFRRLRSEGKFSSEVRE